MSRRLQWITALVAGLGLAIAGCPQQEKGDWNPSVDASGADGADGSGDPDGRSGSDGANGADGGGDAAELPDLPDQPDCDPMMTARCALPWPSNKYLAEDGGRKTGHTLSFGAKSLPVTDTGDRADPTAWERLDGYGLGTPIMVAYEDPDASQFPNETAIEKSMNDDATILLYEVEDGSLKRIPYWAEVDSKADSSDDHEMVLVRPAVILDPDTRYVVAFRGLEHADGSSVEPSAAFQRLLADAVPDESELAEREKRFDEIFGMLEDEGVDPESLTVAWDFHTASHEALHGTMVRMRDRGLKAVGPKGPELTIDSVDRYYEPSSGKMTTDPHKALRVEGEFRVPRFTEETTIAGTKGWTLHRDSSGTVTQNGWKKVPFWLVVPHSALNKDPSGGTPTGNGNEHGLMQYGHGLLGTGSLTDRDYNRKIADTYDFLVFGASLTGMKSADQSTALSVVSNISTFPLMGDRLHQGLLEYVLLMRAMRNRLADTSVANKYGLKIAPDDNYYSGISQGGIFGGSFVALSKTIERGHLGVPGNNYSLLLGRSLSFEPFFMIMKSSYPNRLDQLIGVAAIQQLWGQTDPVSYMRHIKEDPFRKTPKHDVLLAPAKGDYLVTVLSNEIAARSENGIKLMSNYAKDVALVNKESYPHQGSGVVLYDYGNPWPEPGNHPPEEMPPGDPHEKPRHEPWHQDQMVHFFRNGEIINTCDRDGDAVCDPK